ncbi:hypothetical protein ADK38_03805, partial [Streptomyces varsoviensis]
MFAKLRGHRRGRAHTGLTRPGQAGRQQLRQSIGQRAMILSGKEALGKKGYTPGDIHDGSAVGRSTGRVTVFLRPAESASARVIGVTDNALFYDEKRVTDQTSVGAGRSGMTMNLAAAPYPAFYTGGLSTVAGDALPAFHAAESDAGQYAVHQAHQVRRVPQGRMLIFEMSLEGRVEGSVVQSRSAAAISALRRFLRGRSKPVDETDGKAFPTGQVFASTFVTGEKLYGLVQKDVAREYGLIDDDTFPAEVDTAFDRAGELNGKVEANRQARLDTEIRLERGYEHLYTLLAEADGIGDEATAAARLPERYQQAVGRLAEDLVDHAVQRDADRRLSEQYARAKQNALSLLAWHQRTPAERGDTPKPEPYEPNEQHEPYGVETSPETVRHPVADIGDGLLTPTPDEAQPALPRYLDADLRKLAVNAASFGGAWAGGRVPPQHQLLRELFKADALREKLSVRRQEWDAARRAGDEDLAALRGGQIAYLQQALEDTVTSAGATLREFNRRVDALLEMADNPAPQDGDAAGMARDTVRHLLDGGDLSVLAGEVADRRQAHERAR